MAKRLSHVDRRGRVKMVDVGDKPVTNREAVARGEIAMNAAALKAIRTGGVANGDPLQTARLAGIMAAKQTSALIPLCHPLPLTHVSVELTPTRHGYRIESRGRSSAQTGGERGARRAGSVAARSTYAMVEAGDRGMLRRNCCRSDERGGRSGTYLRSDRSKRSTRS